MKSTLFDIPPRLPEGLRYQEGFISASEERGLLEEFRSVEFNYFNFKGYVAKRRVAEFGWKHDFETHETKVARPLPGFLEPVRRRAAGFAGIPPEDIAEGIVTEYPPGAPIGWHRDTPDFEIIIGISLLSECVMRFKPYQQAGRIMPLTLQPRSIYVMQGAARWEYQHSIPPVKELRYSITFRTKR